MKLEVGMYVRTKKGIYKINDFIYNNYTQKFTYIDNSGCTEFLEEKQVIKARHNIIDLIKPKDIILGTDGKLYQCWKVYKDYVFTYSKNKQGQTITLVDYQIDKILCYEQFESMSYKIN